jgi:phenylpropionate dioxygenase-like ring-hydroxylating dioxygenase large terminal subunit
VRAFLNACRHRGMQVAEGSGKSRVFVCGYHGWAYQLDGSLSHVPHESGFPGLDRGCHGLVPVEAREQDGLVYVVQQPAPGCWDALADIPRVIEPDQQVLGSSQYTVEANWKIFAEGFIEGLHIKPTHPESFYPFGYDNLNVVETYGRNSRITYPFQRIEKLRGLPPEEQRVDGRLTYVHNLFPNVAIAILSHFTTVVVLDPQGTDRTCASSWTLTNRGKLDSQQAREDAQRDAQFVNNTGAKEDQQVVEAIQRGIASNANEYFTFGLYESLIGHLHRNLHEMLGTGHRG